MICPPCRDAGEETTLGNTSGAEMFHQHCADPLTCPCQHKLESVVIQPDN